MKQTDYIVIQANMVNDLKLSGNRLIIYALIHGFCKDGTHEFFGSINYICEWTNLSRNTVISALKSLVDDKLITKREYQENNVKFCAYSIGSAKIAPVVQNTDKGSANSALGGSAKIAPNNNNSNDKIKDKEEKELKEKFAAFVFSYKKAGGKVRGVETEFSDFTKRHKDWKQIIPYLEMALQREIKARNQAKVNKQFYPEMKMLQTYLGKQRAWELYVTIGENIKEEEYTPSGNYSLAWDDASNAYMYIGYYYDGMDLADGYTDDTRPNGAKVILNNARGTIIWNREIKKWLRN